VPDRTVWQWVAAARRRNRAPRQRDRFRIDDRLRVRLAYWRGNAVAVQRELAAKTVHGGPSAGVAAVVVGL
jgi:putative transposase